MRMGTIIAAFAKISKVSHNKKVKPTYKGRVNVERLSPRFVGFD